MKRNITIPVRALVEHCLRSGDLVLEFSGVSRAMEGIRAHQKIQNKRPAEYKAEAQKRCRARKHFALFFASLRVSSRLKPDFLVRNHLLCRKIKIFF